MTPSLTHSGWTHQFNHLRVHTDHLSEGVKVWPKLPHGIRIPSSKDNNGSRAVRVSIGHTLRALLSFERGVQRSWRHLRRLIVTVLVAQALRGNESLACRGMGECTYLTVPHSRVAKRPVRFL
jgi:hypothetical protein